MKALRHWLVDRRVVLAKAAFLAAALTGCHVRGSIEEVWETPDPGATVAETGWITATRLPREVSTYTVIDQQRPLGAELLTDQRPAAADAVPVLKVTTVEQEPGFCETFKVVDGSRPFGVMLGTDAGFEPVAIQLNCTPPPPVGYRATITRELDVASSSFAVQWSITFRGFSGFSGQCRLAVPIRRVGKNRVVAEATATFMVARN
jgi:hypothetical protein